MAEDKVQYVESDETYGKKGTIVPKAANRSQEDELVAPIGDDAGSIVDIHQRVPQNIIEYDAKGRQTKAFVLDPAAQLRLAKANRVSPGSKLKKSMSYEEAALAGAEQLKPAVSVLEFKKVSLDEEPGLKDSEAIVEQPVLKSAESPREVSFNGKSRDTELDELAASPRIKVRFKGAFGSISVLYNDVFVDGVSLVLKQYADDRQFCEAPSGDQQVVVEVGDTRYTCYPGPSVRLSETSKLMITIFFIEDAPNG